MSGEQEPQSVRAFEERIAADLEWHHREVDPDENEETTPPADERIETCCIWVTECYPPSHALSLISGLKTLGWDTRRPRDPYGDEVNAPRMSAPWLEDLVWSDVKRFVTNPGEVLERVREQLQEVGDTEDLSARLKGLENRLVTKQGEKDRYVRLYTQGHISEGELETYLADLKNQIGNLRLLIQASEADLAQRRERVQVADTTVAWLNLLRERAEEIEEDTPEAFVKRQQLVRLLVERITLHRDEGRKTTVVITYRFGPPDDRAEAEAAVVGNVRNSEEFPKGRKKL